MTQAGRFLQAILFISAWMAMGWLLHLDPYGYLLLGIPLCLVFQVCVRRQPLSSCWVRGSTRFRLDLPGVLLALVFLAVPIWELTREWKGGSWPVRLYFVAGLFGAVGVAFAARRFTMASVRSLAICLATAGVLGCGWMLLATMAQHHPVALTQKRMLFGLGQFLVLLPVCFVMEEVAFRGVLDAHVHHSQDARPWLSALLLSAMWGWWHLPIVPAQMIGVGLIAFPITHAVIGIPLSYSWRRGGNLLAPAIVHALIDAFRNALY